MSSRAHSVKENGLPYTFGDLVFKVQCSKLEDRQKCVIAAIIGLVHWGTWSGQFPIAWIASRVGISESTVKRVLPSLIELGLLRRKDLESRAPVWRILAANVYNLESRHFDTDPGDNIDTSDDGGSIMHPQPGHGGSGGDPSCIPNPVMVDPGGIHHASHIQVLDPGKKDPGIDPGIRPPNPQGGLPPVEVQQEAFSLKPEAKERGIPDSLKGREDFEWLRSSLWPSISPARRVFLEPVLQVWDAWKVVFPGDHKLTKQRFDTVARWLEGKVPAYTVEQLCQVPAGVRLSDWHMAEARYQDVASIFQSSAKIDGHLSRLKAPAATKAQPTGIYDTKVHQAGSMGGGDKFTTHEELLRLSLEAYGDDNE